MVLDRSPQLDRVFHALAHPARRAILRQLSGREQNLSELASPLHMSFPAATKHVRVLERARLVRRRIVGRTHLCRLQPKPLAQANSWLEGYRKVWEGNFQRLDALLNELKSEPNPAHCAKPPATPHAKSRSKSHAKHEAQHLAEHLAEHLARSDRRSIP